MSRTPSLSPLRPPRIAAVVALVLGLFMAVPGSAAGTPVHGVHYVALGDSSAAASGVPDTVDARCMRSNHNYPSIVARRLHVVSFKDVTCDGARTETVFAEQLRAVTRGTNLVTLSIGGNDVGFSRIVAKCTALGTFDSNGSPCQVSYGSSGSGGSDELQGRLAAAEPKVVKLLRAIHRRAPRARVFLVGYLRLVPVDHRGCRPREMFGNGDLAYLGTFENAVNRMLAQAARRGHAVFVNNHPASLRHDFCEARNVRWSEALFPTNPALPFHPNARGERAMANAVLAAVRR
ncbi:SGNH/GDSL hydrolase family protein [Streptomyces sp. RB6PN25]|uniref:SGNH/GDSL hydrolase family protein n=1 Tax=Streptomyces humicola TaxID=2953240 RepID=A0ABT1PZT5_9ACTN|nr:SGNH/GDSL hydrolase family protein [Streptomyces humicola]MCQ4083192.1 SGNH/GDSL hydrolase family protein [Streptomyces humicola]